MENKVIIQGKELDISGLTEEQMIKLFTGLKEREAILRESISKLERELELIQRNT